MALRTWRKIGLKTRLEVKNLLPVSRSWRLINTMIWGLAFNWFLILAAIEWHACKQLKHLTRNTFASEHRRNPTGPSRLVLANSKKMFIPRHPLPFDVHYHSRIRLHWLKSNFDLKPRPQVIKLNSSQLAPWERSVINNQDLTSQMCAGSKEQTIWITDGLTGLTHWTCWLASSLNDDEFGKTFHCNIIRANRPRRSLSLTKRAKLKQFKRDKYNYFNFVRILLALVAMAGVHQQCQPLFSLA